MTRIPDAKKPKAPRRKAPQREKEKLVQVILNRGIIASSRKIVQGNALLVFKHYRTSLEQFDRGNRKEKEIPSVVERTMLAFSRCRERSRSMDFHPRSEANFFMWEELEKIILGYIREKKVSAARAVELYLADMFKEGRNENNDNEENLKNHLYVVTFSLLIDVLNEKENTIDDIRERIEAVKGPVVLFCRDVPDSAVGILTHPKVVAVVREEGGNSDHKTSILRDLKKLGVAGVRGACAKVKDNSEVIIDGVEGRIFVNPSPATSREYRRKIKGFAKALNELALEKDLPAQTLDKMHVRLGLNIGASSAVEDQFADGGYDYIGLARTENILALNQDGRPRRKPPEMGEQIQLYEKLINILHAVNTKITIPFRTVDLDKDKTLPYLSLTDKQRQDIKENGFSMFLNPGNHVLYFLFKNQLEALLRARGKKSIMFPNVFNLKDFGRAMAIVDDILASRPSSEADRIREQTTFGIMVEHPNIIHDLGVVDPELRIESKPDLQNLRLRKLSFMSIGTNDLTRYVLGVSRTSPEYDELHPEVIKAIGNAADVGGKLGLDVSVCGDMGSDPLALPVLLGLGIRSISFSPDFVHIGRYMIKNIRAGECEPLIMALEKGSETAEFTRDVLKGYISMKIGGPWKGLSPLKELILD